MNGIVVTIPKGSIKAVESEEQEVNNAIASGEKGWVYWWKLSSTPKKRDISRIYFLWDGAVRAYHDIIHIYDCGPNTGGPEIVMKPEIHSIIPIEMKPFRGFQYFNVPVYNTGKQ